MTNQEQRRKASLAHSEWSAQRTKENEDTAAKLVTGRGHVTRVDSHNIFLEFGDHLSVQLVRLDEGWSVVSVLKIFGVTGKSTDPQAALGQSLEAVSQVLNEVSGLVEFTTKEKPRLVPRQVEAWEIQNKDLVQRLKEAVDRSEYRAAMISVIMDPSRRPVPMKTIPEDDISPWKGWDAEQAFRGMVKWNGYTWRAAPLDDKTIGLLLY